MDSQNKRVSRASSRVLKGKQLVRSERTELPSVSFRRATEDMVNDGISVYASLKDDKLSPEIECMAAEFQGAVRGDFQSIIAPMTIKLKNSEDTTKVRISTMEKFASMLPNYYPFYRIDKLKILYLPLFSGEIGEGKEITFSIKDTSVRESEASKTVTSCVAPLNKMSMIELRTPFFVQTKNLNVIEFCYKAKNVPIIGRSFAMITLGFHIERAYIPTTVKKQKPLILLIEELDAPEDLNKKSGIENLIKGVNSKVAGKKKNEEKFRLKQEEVEDERYGNIMFVDDLGKINKGVDSGYNSEEEERAMTSGVKKMELRENRFTKMDIADFLPRSLPVAQWDKVILDTGAPDHWFYNPDISDLKALTRKDDLIEGETFHKVKGVEVKLGVHWIRLKEVLYGRKDDFPLISFLKLMRAGIVNQIQSIGTTKAVLKLDDQIIFSLSCEGNYMVFDQSDDLSREIIIE